MDAQKTTNFGLMYDTLMIPTPKSELDVDLGCCSNFCLVLQIITGIVLVIITHHMLIMHSTVLNIS